MKVLNQWAVPLTCSNIIQENIWTVMSYCARHNFFRFSKIQVETCNENYDSCREMGNVNLDLHTHFCNRSLSFRCRKILETAVFKLYSQTFRSNVLSPTVSMMEGDLAGNGAFWNTFSQGFRARRYISMSSRSPIPFNPWNGSEAYKIF